MLVLVALNIMSVPWMAVITVLTVAQKLLPENAIDVSVAMAMLGLGILILVAPSSVPGLMPSIPMPMHAHNLQ